MIVGWPARSRDGGAVGRRSVRGPCRAGCLGRSPVGSRRGPRVGASPGRRTSASRGVSCHVTGHPIGPQKFRRDTEGRRRHYTRTALPTPQPTHVSTIFRSSGFRRGSPTSVPSSLIPAPGRRVDSVSDPSTRRATRLNTAPAYRSKARGHGRDHTDTSTSIVNALGRLGGLRAALLSSANLHALTRPSHASPAVALLAPALSTIISPTWFERETGERVERIECIHRHAVERAVEPVHRQRLEHRLELRQRLGKSWPGR